MSFKGNRVRFYQKIARAGLGTALAFCMLFSSVIPAFANEQETTYINQVARDISGSKYRLHTIGQSLETGGVRAKFYEDTYHEVTGKSSGIMKEKPYTVFVYMCGTNLESECDPGSATVDIMNMIRSRYDMSRVNVILCAGGTKNWKNPYMSSAGEDSCNNDAARLNLYYLNPDAYTGEGDADGDNAFQAAEEVINADTLKLLASLDTIDMGTPQLLAGAIDFCTDLFPAQEYGAILWNHGGGINEGICFSESFDYEKDGSLYHIDGTAITPAELESALAATKLFKEGRKYAFIGFDACLMGSTELAYELSPYSCYMIASSELSYDGWDYRTIFKLISDSTTSKLFSTWEADRDVAQKITKSYYDYKDGDYVMASIACFDLSKMEKVEWAVDKAARAVLDVYQDETTKDACFGAMKQARIHSMTLGSGDSVYGNRDYVDIKDFMVRLREELLNVKASVDESSDAYKKLDKADKCIQNVLVQQFLVTSGVKYLGKSIQYTQDAGKMKNDANYDNEDFWTDLQDAQLYGASIMVPYYNTGLIAALGEGLDGNNTVVEMADSYKNYRIFPDYTDLMALYAYDSVSGQMQSQANNLRTIQYSNLINSVSMKMSKDIRYLSVELYNKSYADGRTSFSDFMDTLANMSVYITRNQTMDLTRNNSESIDLIYGKQEIGFSAISNSTEQINIMKSLMETSVTYRTIAKDVERNQYVSDIVYTQGYTGSKDVILRALAGRSYQESEWLIAEGQIGRGEQAKKDKMTVNDLRPAILCFQADRSSDTAAYKLAGAVCVNRDGRPDSIYRYQENGTLVNEENAEEFFDVVKFYHYSIIGGKEQAIEKSDLQNDFRAPALLARNLCLYAEGIANSFGQGQQSDDFTKYNQYFVAFTSKNEGAKPYIAASEAYETSSSVYYGYERQVGAKEAEAEQKTDSLTENEQEAAGTLEENTLDESTPEETGEDGTFCETDEPVEDESEVSRVPEKEKAAGNHKMASHLKKH